MPKVPLHALLLLLFCACLWAGDTLAPVAVTPPPSDTCVPLYRSAACVPGTYFDRDGSRFIITRAQIREMHALNLADVLDFLPGIIVARSSFAGTLSDIKIQGRESTLDDKPVVLEIDGMEVRNLNADRTYLSGIAVAEAEWLTVETGGGLSGSELLIRMTTRDSYITPALTRVVWETGPFDMNGVKFSLMRRLGRKTGLYVGMEKVYQSEGMGFFFNDASNYYHPAAISDIYGAFLRRPASDYVADGHLFENSTSLWNVRLNTIVLPGINLCAGYETIRDFQDDYRDFTSQGITKPLNFASRHFIDRFSLQARTRSLGRFEGSAHLYWSTLRLRYPYAVQNPKSGDSSSFVQGDDVLGAVVQARFRGTVFSPYAKLDAAQDDIHASRLAASLKRTALETGIRARFDSLPGIPAELTLRNTLRRDNRSAAFLASPFADGSLRLFKNALLLCGSYGCEQRFPEIAALYYENPKLRYAPDTLHFERQKSYLSSASLTYQWRQFSTGYRLTDVFTLNPALFDTLSMSNYIPTWTLSQHLLSHEQRTGHEFFVQYTGEHLVENAACQVTQVSALDTSGRRSSFNTFNLTNALKLRRNALKGRFFMQSAILTHFRQEVLAQDFYSGVQPELLPYYIAFDVEFEFRIKTFDFYARFQNLGNYVISYEPGYHLPGPLIRWGIDWSFGG